MPILTGRPDNVIRFVKARFSGLTVSPFAQTNPEAEYQRLAEINQYVAKTQNGFVLTDLGRREIENSG